ncbi:MAG: BCD family MFS transporter [Myxococcota bacterium]
MSGSALRRTGLGSAWGARLLPFADAATVDLPLARLLRLSLFQVSVGIGLVLLNGTLNRVMIVELGLPVWLVSAMISIPVVFAPVRALIGFRSDVHRSALGWRRVPFIWMGTLVQFGGLAIMPFAIIVLSGRTELVPPPWMGPSAAALAFLLVGAGLHTTQTAGLALATDLASEAARPRVVALLYVVFLIGSIVSATLLGWLLGDFSDVRLVEVIQGAAVATMVLNGVALWKQEPRRPRVANEPPPPSFAQAWSSFAASGRSVRFLVAVGLGTLAFTMQDILLEPYGGEVLGLPVGSTTLLTALFSAGMLAAFALAARRLARGADLHRLSAIGLLVGVAAFVTVLLSAPFASATAFRCGTFLIGLGGGLFSVGTLTAAMSFRDEAGRGLALGAWGAVQATAAGLGVFLGGAIRDVVGGLASSGRLGPALSVESVGYGAVYQLEIVLLFATLVAIGPLAGSMRREQGDGNGPGARSLGLAEFPR